MTDEEISRLSLPELVDLLAEVASEIEIRAMQCADEGCQGGQPFCLKEEGHEHL